MSHELYEDALRRAFVGHRADYIAVTSRRQQFLLSGAEYGVEKGWLKRTIHNPDEQSTAYIYRLTDEGRRHFWL